MMLSELLSRSQEYLNQLHTLKKADIPILRGIIREHNYLYYNKEAPIISDTEYDRLFHALARLEAKYKCFDSSSPTRELAIITSEQFQKVKHIYPMISLDNTYNVEEVQEFENRIRRILEKYGEKQEKYDYYIQPKYDGLGLAVIYEYGEYKQAITRGSGKEGEDVTLTAFEIENLPKKIEHLKDTNRMEIRGEVIMNRNTFLQVNNERQKNGEKLFSNPRNCASGSLRQIDPLITRSRNLQFFAYSIPQIESDPNEMRKYSLQNYHEIMDLLSLWGFSRADFTFSKIHGIESLCRRIDEETRNRREYFDFDIDGMVLKLDNMSLWNILGHTEHHPRYSIAYKFPAKQVRTRVISIEHSVGRTGIVTPVANLEPVDISGVIVRRATLHNYDELEKKGVREGDCVFVMRAGEVIPEIVSVISDVRTGDEKIVLPPKNCPVCGLALQKDNGMVAIYCPNNQCPAKIQGQLEMFVGKDGLDIEGLGPKQIELFLKLGWIYDFASIFDLVNYREQLLSLEGYKEKSVQNLIDALMKARKTELHKVLVAIGIPNIGKRTAKIITKRMEELHIQDIYSITIDNLLEIQDIGPKTAFSFFEYIHNNKEVIKRLFSVLEIQAIGSSHREEGIGKVSSIYGKSFCVTGSFEDISRNEIHDFIEKHGGEIRNSVSGKLDYLIVGENPGSKKSKAEDLGIRMITLDELYEMEGV